MAGMGSTRLDFGILLVLAYQQFVTELRATLSEQGFTDQGRSDGYVLRALDAAAITVSELAERLEISKQGAGQLIDDMERRGYVERRPNPDDRRGRRAFPFEKGRPPPGAGRRVHPRGQPPPVPRHRGGEGGAPRHTAHPRG